MTLIIQKPTGAKLNLAQTYVGTDDPDAAVYVAAVEAADEAASPGVGALETATKVAIHSFVKGCKNDGIWPAIKASCILAGARTLTGALVPLVGTAPTNVGGLFVAGDYNRKTGLVGNGSTKYLDSNRNNNVDPRDNKHVAVYASSLPTVSTKPMLGLNRFNTEAAGATLIYDTLTRCHDNTSSVYTASAGFIGLTRSAAASYTRRNGGSDSTLSQASTTVVARNISLFGDSLQNVPTHSDARLAFYSIGESLDLALLDARVTDLINAFAAAIP
jgi:hypothetical protein